MWMLIPHLFADRRLLDAVPGSLRLDALETALGRGRVVPCTTDGVEAAFCEMLAVPRQSDWPVAPITLETDGTAAGDAHWLRADPVHWRVMRDRIVLDRAVTDLTRLEAETLTRAIADHFGSRLSPRAVCPARWYLESATAPALETTPLASAIGRDIGPLLPLGEAARPYRAMLNEVQMLLHDHPVNTDREARGLLAVNAIWLWGGGKRPEKPQTKLCEVWADAGDAARIAAWCGYAVRRVPPRIADIPDSGRAIVVIGALESAAQSGDPYGWAEALAGLERDWFSGLLSRRAERSTITISDPINGRALVLGPTDRWKFWRRCRALADVCTERS